MRPLRASNLAPARYQPPSSGLRLCVLERGGWIRERPGQLRCCEQRKGGDRWLVLIHPGQQGLNWDGCAVAKPGDIPQIVPRGVLAKP